MEEDDEGRTILVSGVPTDFRLEAIQHYFENKSRSNGGPIKGNPKWIGDSGKIIITFQLAKDAENVVQRKVHNIGKYKLHVNWYKILIWQEDAMIVSNGHKDMSEEMLIDFLEKKGKLDVVYVSPRRKPGTFLVYCQNEIDFEYVKKMCQKNLLNGNQLKVDRIEEINSVQVKTVSSNVSFESLKSYFRYRERSSGGDISSIQQQTSDTYIVSFKEKSETTSLNTSLLGPQRKAAPMPPRTNETSTETVDGVKINLMIGSISNASVDVIVNSTNKYLQLNDGSISKFILNAAGPQMQVECSQKYPQGISTCKIAITKGYNLSCKNVFHLTLPPWGKNSSHLTLANLTQIITICLHTAERMGAKSLAFPILGAGVLKYPIKKLPRTMYKAVKNYSNQNSSQIKDVYFVVYPQDTEIVKIFKEYFQQISADGSVVTSELIPNTWSPMGDKELIKIVPVTSGPEYDDIQATFHRNLPLSRIIKIERIQNKTLYHGYQTLKKKYEVENPQMRNEVDGLWHGTAAGSVDGINKSGFNCSYCGKNATAFGEGVYFARDIQYSANDVYSTPDHHGIKKIYKCSVLVGRMMQGQHGLKVLQDSYNSAVNNIRRPSIYVIFHDSHAYPNYLITFSNH